MCPGGLACLRGRVCGPGGCGQGDVHPPGPEPDPSPREQNDRTLTSRNFVCGNNFFAAHVETIFLFHYRAGAFSKFVVQTNFRLRKNEGCVSRFRDA